MIRSSAYRVLFPTLILSTSLVFGCGKDEQTFVVDEGPKVARFDVSPLSVEAGQVAVLSWETEGATAISISTVDGTPIELGEATAAIGTVKVRPLAATVYVLEATDATGRTVKSTTMVAVSAARAPTATLQTRDSRIDFGTSTELSWTTSRTSSVRIEAGGEVLFEGAQAEGVLEISPTRQTDYVLVATGPGGEDSKSVNVSVAPVVRSFTSDAKGAVIPGAPVTLRWETAGAESLVISTPDGFEYVVPEEARGQGEVEAPMGVSGRFILTATLGAIQVHSNVEVPIETGPVVAGFAATPAAVTLTGTVSLSWKTLNTAFVTIEATPGGFLATQVPERDGAIDAEVTQDTSFRIYATGLDGTTTTATFDVRSLPEPTIKIFDALPAKVGRGEEVALSWETVDADRAEIEIDGEVRADYLAPNGSVRLPIQEDATIVLRAFNGADFPVESALEVKVGPPEILSFASDVARVHAGDQLRFSWSILGGTSLQIAGPNGPVSSCTTTVPGVISAGTCVAPAPAVEGATEFKLSVTNGAGQTTSGSTMIMIREGPLVLDLTADVSEVSEGDPVVLSWVVTPDAHGASATLSVEDDLGVVYPIADPASGSATIQPMTPGDRTFSLIASTNGTLPDRADVDVKVWALPTVTLTASAPNYDPVVGIPVIVSWTTTDAESVAVYQLDANGAPIQPPLREGTGAWAAAGSMSTTPIGLTTFRAVAANVLGGERSAEVSIDAPNFAIVSFTATPATVAPGGQVTLEWQTVGATSVSLDAPQLPTMTTGNDPYIDITTSSNKLVVPQDDCSGSPSYTDEGCALITFPNGFTFPFEGTPRSQARVYVNGIVSFDLNRTGNSYGLTTPIPSTSQPWAHMVLAWADLYQGSTNMVYETRTDARGQYLIIQWPHFQFTDLNFEILMWEDGYFEYRYGLMSGFYGYAGYQNTMGTAGISIVSYGSPPSNTTYRFTPPVLAPSAGSLTARPSATRTYTLTAYGPGGLQASATVPVTVQ